MVEHTQSNEDNLFTGLTSDTDLVAWTNCYHTSQDSKIDSLSMLR
jgi:hypothetical protein